MNLDINWLSKIKRDNDNNTLYTVCVIKLIRHVMLMGTACNNESVDWNVC